MEIAVIGGGIVGCHIAYRLAQEGKEVFLLEKEKALESTRAHETAVSFMEAFIILRGPSRPDYAFKDAI